VVDDEGNSLPDLIASSSTTDAVTEAMDVSCTPCVTMPFLFKIEVITDTNVDLKAPSPEIVAGSMLAMTMDDEI